MRKLSNMFLAWFSVIFVIMGGYTFGVKATTAFDIHCIQNDKDFLRIERALDKIDKKQEQTIKILLAMKGR